jgi:hypothetical protein
MPIRFSLAGESDFIHFANMGVSVVFPAERKVFTTSLMLVIAAPPFLQPWEWQRLGVLKEKNIRFLP